MSGEGWAAGKILISKCGRRQPKLWEPRMGDTWTGRQRQGFVTEKETVTEHLQRCEADGGGRNKVAGDVCVVEWQNGGIVEWWNGGMVGWKNKDSGLTRPRSSAAG